MKSQLLAVRTTHHVEESQLDQMLGRHESRTVDYVSFLVSPPCHTTNFMRMEKFELASTADEAQGANNFGVADLSSRANPQMEVPMLDESQVVASEKRPTHTNRDTHLYENTNSLGNTGAANVAPDFSILHRPHIVRSKEEVHMIFCSGGCERVAHGKCDCGVPLCNNCRYLPNGERSIFGDCKECSKVPQDSTEIFSNGRQI